MVCLNDLPSIDQFVSNEQIISGRLENWKVFSWYQASKSSERHIKTMVISERVVMMNLSFMSVSINLMAMIYTKLTQWNTSKSLVFQTQFFYMQFCGKFCLFVPRWNTTTIWDTGRLHGIETGNQLFWFAAISALVLTILILTLVW